MQQLHNEEFYIKIKALRYNGRKSGNNITENKVWEEDFYCKLSDVSCFYKLLKTETLEERYEIRFKIPIAKAKIFNFEKKIRCF